MKINYKVTTYVLLVILLSLLAYNFRPNSHGMMDMTMNDMVHMMNGKTGKDLEKEFILGMIPHHQGAVEMSKLLLQDKTISDEMRQFAENIIRAQEEEIRMMNSWLKSY